MILDVKEIFLVDGLQKSFSFDLDLSDVDFWGNHPIQPDTKITGSVENQASIVTLRYTADVTLDYDCDKCLDHVTKKIPLKFEHVVVTELFSEDEDEFLVAENDRLDLSEIAASDIILAMPMRFLCKEDCKGLCPQCGCNLNHSTCHCSTKQIDPRLEALKQLLE